MPQDSTIIDKTSEALGIDSLIAVEMRSWLLKELDVDLPLLLIIGGKTMREMLQACRARMDPAMMPLLQATESLADGGGSRLGEEDTKAEMSTEQQPLVATARAQSGTTDKIPSIKSAGNSDTDVTEVAADASSAPTLQHVSCGKAVPADARPDTESLPLISRLPNEQKSSQAQNLNGGGALRQANFKNLKWDDHQGVESQQPIEVKGGAVGVCSVSDVSSSCSPGPRDVKKSKGLFGRLINSRRFGRLRRYL